MMLKDAAREIRLHPGRFVATLIAIAISVAYMAGSSIFIETQRVAMGNLLARPLAQADAIVSSGDPAAGPLLKSQPDVAAVAPIITASMVLSKGDRTAVVEGYVVPPEEFRWARTIDGRWPTARTEVALSRAGAKSLGATVGDELKPPEWVGGDVLRLVGITDDPDGLFTTTGYLASTPGADSASGWVVKAKPGVSPQALVDAIGPTVRSKLGPDTKVSTAEAEREARLLDLTGQFDILKYMFQVFAVIALLVGMIIIANTFTILLAQRRRQIGLLRAVGASGSQVRRKFLAEAVLIGLLGSALGVVLGMGLAAAGASYTNALHWGLALPWRDLVVALLVGTLATVIAAIAPSLRATRVAPLEALQTVPTAEQARRATTARIVVCSVFGVAGIALTVLSQVATNQWNLAYGIGAGVCLTVAVLGLARLYVPAMLRGLGKIFGFTGPLTRLAAENSARNPQRASATAVALMLAMGLIVTLQVAAATMRTSAADSINAHYPIHLTVNADAALTPDQIERFSHFPGVETSTALEGKPIDVEGGRVLVLKGEQAVRELAPSFSDKLTDQTVLVTSTESRPSLSLEPGGTPLKARTADWLDYTQAIVTDTNYATVSGSPQTSVLWLKLGSGVDFLTVYNDVGSLARELGVTVTIGGSAMMIGIIDQFVFWLLVVLTALLGVAVVIALVGVANTLGLSVIERRRESALLRALGMQRAGLRVMLLIEALMLALVGAGVGIAAGFFFGWLGASSAFKTMADPTMKLHFAVDWGWTFLLLGIAAAAAALASILPGRRAAMATPTEALADE